MAHDSDSLRLLSESNIAFTVLPCDSHFAFQLRRYDHSLDGANAAHLILNQPPAQLNPVFIGQHQ